MRENARQRILDVVGTATTVYSVCWFEDDSLVTRSVGVGHSDRIKQVLAARLIAELADSGTVAVGFRSRYEPL